VALCFNLITEGWNKALRHLLEAFNRNRKMQVFNQNQISRERRILLMPASPVEEEKKRTRASLLSDKRGFGALLLNILDENGLKKAGNDCGKKLLPFLITLARLEFEMSSTKMSPLAAASSSISDTPRNSCRATLSPLNPEFHPSVTSTSEVSVVEIANSIPLLGGECILYR
jgi:hypothetical protein